MYGQTIRVGRTGGGLFDVQLEGDDGDDGLRFETCGEGMIGQEEGGTEEGRADGLEYQGQLRSERSKVRETERLRLRKRTHVKNT